MSTFLILFLSAVVIVQGYLLFYRKNEADKYKIKKEMAQELMKNYRADPHINHDPEFSRSVFFPKVVIEALLSQMRLLRGSSADKGVKIYFIKYADSETGEKDEKQKVQIGKHSLVLKAALRPHSETPTARTLMRTTQSQEPDYFNYGELCPAVCDEDDDTGTM